MRNPAGCGWLTLLGVNWAYIQQIGLRAGLFPRMVRELASWLKLLSGCRFFVHRHLLHKN